MTKPIQLLLLPLALAISFAAGTPVVAQDDPGAAEASAPATERPTMLRLKSGDVLWGSVAAHEPEAIEFRRLDTQGLVTLPWSFLDPAEERELRERFGYVDSQAEELVIDAERVVLADQTEIIGHIVNRTDQHVWFKRAEGTIPVDKSRIRGASTLVQVPALEIYTKEELYQEKAFELQSRLVREGTEGARAHDELAQYAERLYDYPHAVQHYRHAQALDASYDAERIAAALVRAESKAENQEQVDLLAEIDLMRARKRYDLAIELIQKFRDDYAGSPLLEDLNAMAAKVARYQERDLRAEIVRRTHYWSVRLARDAVREHENFEAVISYLDEGMTEDLFAKVVEDVQRIAPGIEPDQVRRLWDERSKGRARNASYGIGTWLLGDRALVTYEEEEEEQEEEPPPGSARAARKSMEERLERYLKNQETARRARGGGGASDEEDPNELWSRWNHSGRYQWTLAYFAEFSGVFEVERAKLSNCRECGGTGTREILFLGSAMAEAGASAGLVPCPTCHTIGRVRRIRYR